MKILAMALAATLFGLSMVASGVNFHAWPRAKTVPIERATNFKATSWVSPPCGLWIEDLFLKFELIPVNGCTWDNEDMIFA